MIDNMLNSVTKVRLVKKIGILIPCTSNGRDWTTFKETYLFNMTLKSFLLSYDKEHIYTFYIGIDSDDKVFDDKETHKEIVRFLSVMKNVNVSFIYLDDAAKGHLTKMWNILFEIAYKENNDYFFQCGDDIVFTTKGWVNDCIKTLQQHKDMGLVGPINNNMRLLTQCFVSKKHYEIFGYFFPNEIVNWCCDDWINDVYKPDLFFPLRNHFCSNQGGKPRYIINNDHEFSGLECLMELKKKVAVYVERDKEKIKKYKTN
tara:strand:+ start:353 stop:1129 length:777 start_codon:yes stop_codon:yes gene_type:complete